MGRFWGQEPNPRKIPSGTSYTSKGANSPSPDAYKELGTSKSQPIRDIVPELGRRQQALRVYEQMARNDASVDVSLRAAKTPVMGATFYIEAFDDKPENQDIAEFTSFNILEGLSQPFLIVLQDVLTMYEAGFSILEPVWEQREWAPRRTGANRRRYTMLKKLAPRPASTISEFIYDDTGGPVGVKQMKILEGGRTEEVEIPIEKLIIFTFNRSGGNLEGKSLLRTAYKHWYYKDNLYKIDAIQKERHALGIPKATLQPGYKQKDVDAAWELVRNLRTNEEAGMVLPPEMDVEFVKFQGELVSVIDSIEHHEGRILLNVMVQFLLLGLSMGGGRATSGSHLDMFHKSLRYVGNMICDFFNLYLIPRLVVYNFNTQEFPRMRVRNIGEGRDMQMWASAMANLASRNLITLDLETEQWVREQIDAPTKLGGRQTPEANTSTGDNQRGGINPEVGDHGAGRRGVDVGFDSTE